MVQITIDQAIQIAIQHHQAGRFAEAERVYRQILGQQPTYAKAHYNLAVLCMHLGRLDEAIAEYRHAIACEPTLAMAFNDLAIALQRKGEVSEATEADFNEAINAFRQAVALLPGSATACMNLGSALMRIGEHDEAIKLLRRSVELDPTLASARSILIYAAHFHPDFDAAALFKEARRYSELVEPSLARTIAPHTNDRSPDRRLRIGYVSPHFRGHPVARFLLPLLEHHDTSQVEVFCYSGVTRPDDTTARFKKMCGQYIEVAALSDAQLAERIRADRIDILVDLTLHMMGNRLQTFARKPAPVQVSWLGYAGTTGLSSMDYRLTDSQLDPPADGDAHYSEKSIHLPHSYWCYEPYIETIEPNPLPATTAGFVTLGCCNGFIKTTAPALELWGRILSAIPGSHLLLHCPPGDHRKRVIEKFARSGVGPDRIEFVGNKSIGDYLLGYHRIDIALDPFPYGGGTTTCDALWMGVPTVTLRGRTAVGRGGASILSSVGLSEWIADSTDQYLSIAKAMADDLSALAKLRANMRGTMRGSALMNGKIFAADMEAAYRGMWENWVSGHAKSLSAR